MVSESERFELDHLRASLGEWALGDIKKANAGGARMGVFILAAHLIDVLARLAYSKPAENGKAAWHEFVPAYLPRYAGLADLMYRGYRGRTSHDYSAEGVRFTDGPTYRHRHLRVEDGERVLHLESFVEDMEAAFERFCSDLEDDAGLRDRVLRRVRRRPLLGIVGGGAESASVASNPTIATLASATSFSSEAATGSPAPPPDPVRFRPPLPPPRMDIPRGGKRRRKKG